MSLTKREKSQIRVHIGYLLDTQCERCAQKSQFPTKKRSESTEFIKYCNTQCPVGIRIQQMYSSMLIGKKVNFSKMKPVKAPMIKAPTATSLKRHKVRCVDCQHETYRPQKEDGFGACTKCNGRMKLKNVRRGRPPKQKEKVSST